MDARQVQVLLLLLSFALAIFVLIASSKYAEWARPMTAEQGSWLPLVFYIGTIPLLSLLYSTLHLIGLHFDLLPARPSPGTGTSNSKSTAATKNNSNADANTDPVTDATLTLTLLVFAALQSLGWLIQASLCTACELRPILSGTEGHVPLWCPQSRFHDTGEQSLARMLGQLATAKDFVQWFMVVLGAGLIECARREWVEAERVKTEYRMGGNQIVPDAGVGQTIELANLNTGTGGLKRSGTVAMNHMYESRV